MKIALSAADNPPNSISSAKLMKGFAYIIIPPIYF